MENKISVIELIKDEQRQKEEGQIYNKLKVAFALQNKIKSLNGFYLKSEKNVQFRIYTPKNTSATIHFLDNDEIVKTNPKIENAQRKQKMYIEHLTILEKDLIKANVGYMPYLQH